MLKQTHDRTTVDKVRGKISNTSTPGVTEDGKEEKRSREMICYHDERFFFTCAIMATRPAALTINFRLRPSAWMFSWPVAVL